MFDLDRRTRFFLLRALGVSQKEIGEEWERGVTQQAIQRTSSEIKNQVKMLDLQGGDENKLVMAFCETLLTDDVPELLLYQLKIRIQQMENKRYGGFPSVIEVPATSDFAKAKKDQYDVNAY